MPTSSYPYQRPEDVLSQIQQTPITDPSQGEAAAEYTDLPAQEAIRAYINTGKMPTTMRVQPRGTLESIWQSLGLRAKEQPITPDVVNRAGIAKKQADNQQAMQRLQMIMGVGQEAAQFGGKFGQQAMKAVGEPELAGAFDPTQKGKGEIALSAQDVQLQRALASEDIAAQRAATQQLYYQMEIARQQGATQRMQELMNIREGALNLERQKFNEQPVRSIGERGLQSVDAAEQALYGELSKMVNPLTGESLPETDPRWKVWNSRLQELEHRRMGMMQGMSTAKTPAELLQSIQMPMTATSADPALRAQAVEAMKAQGLSEEQQQAILKMMGFPPETGTTSGGRPIKTGLFGGGESKKKSAPAPSATETGGASGDYGPVPTSTPEAAIDEILHRRRIPDSRATAPAYIPPTRPIKRRTAPEL